MRQEAASIVRRALELGVTLFDTAEIYGCEPHRIARRAMLEGVALTDMARVRGFGRSEEILGRSLGDQRESAFLATKFYPAMLASPVPGQRAVASANRLGTHYIDLYQVHQPPHITPPGPCHAGHTRAAASRSDQRSGREQRLPRPLARRRAGAGEPGAEQSGRLQPGQPLGRARPAAVRGVARPRRDRLPPARTGIAVRQVQHRQPADGPRCGPLTRCSCRRTWSAPVV